MTQSAREVIAPIIGQTFGDQYTTDADDLIIADRILSALTAAGYPVESLPAMREALEALEAAGQLKEAKVAGLPSYKINAARRLARAVLAQQEPKP